MAVLLKYVSFSGAIITFKPLPSNPEMNHQVVYGLLGNGLNVIIAPLKETSAVSTWVFAHGGSDYETAENNGVHHFLEHMYFAGTNKRRASRDIWSTIEGNGGAMNAQTDRQVVGYGTVMNYRKLELNLELIADILFHSRFDPEDIEREKGVIIEEKKGSDDIRTLGPASFSELFLGISHHRTGRKHQSDDPREARCLHAGALSFESYDFGDSRHG